MAENSMQTKTVKEDRRILRTRRFLLQAFCALANEKPLPKITVREICDRADVSRATFYLHFDDVYDIYEYIERSALEDIKVFFDKYEKIYSPNASTYAYSDEIYYALIENTASYLLSDMPRCRLLLKSPTFRNSASELIRKIYETLWGKEGVNIKNRNWDALITYHTQGIFACFDHWLEQGFADAAEIKKVIIMLDAAFDKVVAENCS